ncbi:MAG: pyridoxamine 5'-phosphate oxidase family protein [Actinomycetota bacterium]|nr:pyridoxamine 5'-phosphate oxidase family protein [Actinomycetota bacterium]MDH5225436.1 pyridoxamine 5'-phosphate oxidase family protein [Actinomycetota bacterium]MDH5313931.1 pyridoxamine 5'-phosphate oxidase family protein [Actinomycetota bacterium]
MGRAPCRSVRTAEAGEVLLYQYGVGLGFLATVRPDGGPRVHPICPLIHDGGLFAFLVPSPKRTDLLRDGRFSLHSFPVEENEDAFYMTGTAEPVDDERVREALVARFLEERPGLSQAAADLGDQLLFEFRVSTCLLTRTDGHGEPSPAHTVWVAASEGSGRAHHPSPSPGPTP